ncbi:t-SNARE [Naematelia encephala]|uniref:t-SNARE n=1 Tax=Naematelia encephala TaxID=71784 RepID=A0A1Y2BIG2_9TREE|nr:t-SNARE [Naematelia encephala]
MSNPYLPSSPASPFSSAGAGPSTQPITRSRTLFYLSIRDSSAPSYPQRQRRSHVQYGDTIDVAEDDQEALLGGGRPGDVSVGTKGLPPRWVDASDEVEEVLEKVKGKIATLDKLHAKHVLPGFTDRSAEEREIERQTADITRDFRRCSTLISSIQPGPRAPRVEIMTSKNVQRGLAQKVQDLSGQFRKKQRVYMQKLQGHAVKNKDLLAASGAISLRGSDSIDELAEDEHASTTQLQSQSQAQVAVNIDIDQRTKEITQIATSIAELADLFRDLGNLVVEQGTVLDSVEWNVQTAAKELSAGVEELKVAQRYQANTGRRRCILLLVLIIVGLIIVLVYKPRGGPNTISPSPVLDDDTTSKTSSGITIPAPSHTRRPHRPHLPKPSKMPAIPIGDDNER